MRIRKLPEGDDAFVGFVEALSASGLPTEDLFDEPYQFFTMEERAWCGLSVGTEAMLRSVVVDPSVRGLGHGATMVREVCDAAKALGVARIWLLTTTASDFFKRLGWRDVERTDAPEVIASTKQFGSLCPASAVLMVRDL